MCQHWQKFLIITAGLSLSFQLSLAVVLNLDLKVFLATLNRFSSIFEIQSKLFVSSVILVTGEGQFGKVYACVNLDTGELMAVKQVCWP